MADETDDNREQGVDFGSLADELERLEYPVENGELLEEYGDRELDLESGSQTLRTVLGPQEGTTYESADGVRQAVFTMVGDGAVGREGYSDRGETGRDDPDDEADESV